MKALILILVLSFTAFSSEIRLSEYTNPNDGINDSAGMQNAIDHLAQTGGGTIVIDAGVWNFTSSVSFVTYDNINNSFVIRAAKGAVILPDLPSDQFLFVGGNQNQLVFENLVVAGDGTLESDFGGFLFSNFVNQTRITNCQFFGLRAQSSLIFLGNTDAVVKDSLFYGISSDSVIRAADFRGLTVADTEFIDYGHLNGIYYSKTPLGNNYWIKASATPQSINALGQRALLLQNVRFDEGAAFALEAKGVTYLEAKGITANLSGMDGTAGFYLDNVAYADIKMSKFGYTKRTTPAIRAVNNTTVNIDSMIVDKGVFYGSRDQGSRAFFNLKACTHGCGFVVQ